MKKAPAKKRGELRREYDLSKLRGRVRGKYAKRAQGKTNLVLLEPDVAEAFPDAESVNQALRMLATVARRQPRSARRVRKGE